MSAFTVDRDAFTSALDRAGKVTIAKPTTPGGNCARICAASGALTIDSTDGIAYIEVRVQAEVSKPGAFGIVATDLAEKVRRMPAGPVRFAQTDKHITIGTASKRRAFVQQWIDESETNVAEAARYLQGRAGGVEIDSKKMAGAIARVLHAVGNDPGAANQYGVTFDPKDGKIAVFAATSPRSAIVDTGAPAFVSEGRVLHRAAASVVAAELGANEKARVEVDDRGFVFRFDGSTVCVTHVSAKPLPLRQVLQQAEKLMRHQVTVGRAELEDVVSAMAAVRAIGSLQGEIVLVADDGRMHVSRSGEQDSGEDSLDADVVGGRCSVHLEPKYLADALKQCTGERVTLEMGEPLEPVLIREPGATFVIMPIRPRDYSAGRAAAQ